MAKRKGFTLIEIILVVLISSSIIVIMYRLLETLPRVKNFNDARQTLIQQTNDAMDRFAIIFQDYTVDYEEYYNRRITGCGGKKGDEFKRNVGLSGYCAEPTNYGNGIGSVHDISYTSNNSTTPFSFGEYKNAFWDYGTDTDGVDMYGNKSNDTNAKHTNVGDADDRDNGKGPIAIGDASNIKELYLISHDGSRRIFLRRILKPYEGTDRTNYGTGYYKLQMLKLRGFDAGSKHSFSGASDFGVFDGQIDTRACDAGQMFKCSGISGKSPSSIYPGYELPHDQNDGWADLFDEKLNILDWNIEIYPVKDPDLAWAEMDQQINPYIKISLTAGLSEHLSSTRNWGGTGGFQYTLESTFDTKGFYIK